MTEDAQNFGSPLTEAPGWVTLPAPPPKESSMAPRENLNSFQITRADIERAVQSLAVANVRPMGCQHANTEVSVVENTGGWVRFTCVDCGHRVGELHPLAYLSLLATEESEGVSK
jgi:hypothetical protein